MYFKLPPSSAGFASSSSSSPTSSVSITATTTSSFLTSSRQLRLQVTGDAAVWLRARITECVQTQDTLNNYPQNTERNWRGGTVAYLRLCLWLLRSLCWLCDGDGERDDDCEELEDGLRWEKTFLQWPSLCLIPLPLEAAVVVLPPRLNELSNVLWRGTFSQRDCFTFNLQKKKKKS